MQTVIALIVTLGILVTIHEFGHFWVARRCGVKVLRFAWGFGTPLVRWKDRHDTEFAICALPLGGYVKMLDEREAPVTPDQLRYSFNQQSVYKRIAIAAAGPLANFLFAIVAYWAMFLYGSQVVVPVLGEVAEESVIAKAGIRSGAEIVSVDGKLTQDWSEINLQLIKRLGDTGSIILAVRPPENPDLINSFQLPIANWLTGRVEPDPMAALGIEPFRPQAPAVIEELLADGVAATAGLQPGDKILAINGDPVADSSDLIQRVKSAPEQTLQLTLSRGERELQIAIIPRASESNGETIGLIGVLLESAEYPESHLRQVSYGFIDGLAEAAAKTWEMSFVILEAIRKMVMGQIAIENLGGPITIASAAETSASYGIESFLSFLAYLSVSLGVLNLLPIPMLDGGHLLYYFIEVVKGKPLSEGMQTLGLKIGMALIAIIMVFAFYNDLSRI